jgi:hypothetical protein
MPGGAQAPHGAPLGDGAVLEIEGGSLSQIRGEVQGACSAEARGSSTTFTQPSCRPANMA